MKRFWDTYETRMEIDHERQKILTGELLSENVPETAGAEMEGIGSEIRKVKAGKLGAEKPDTDRLVMEKPDAERKEISENAEKGFFWYLARHKRFAVAAVALMVVVVLAVGGTVGAYAESQAGIFSFFQKDEKRMEAVVNPGGDIIEENLNNEQRFSTIEEMPEEYRKIFMLPLDFYGKYHMEYITVVETALNIAFKVCYNDEFDRYMFCFQRCFKENDTYFYQSYDGYTLTSEKIIEGTKVNFYEGEDKDKDMNIAIFYIENILFGIESNLNIRIIEESVRVILQQNE